MREALVALGVPLVPLAQDGLRVFGSARFPRDQADLFVGNSGLSARTLIAALAFMGGHYRLAGVARMHERPIDDLVTSLVHLGARIAYLESPGRLPLEILPAERTSGLPVRVRGAASSQFLTGLLQAATLLAETGDCCIELEGTLISRPYVA
jgi:3-phosphoshikimate 1-carboxyvinyltransferase